MTTLRTNHNKPHWGRPDASNGDGHGTGNGTNNGGWQIAGAKKKQSNAKAKKWTNKPSGPKTMMCKTHLAYQAGLGKKCPFGKGVNLLTLTRLFLFWVCKVLSDDS